MRTVVWPALILLGLAALADQGRPDVVDPKKSGLDLAREIRHVTELDELVATAFGGGDIYPVEGSSFVVVDLMPTSGMLTTELFVFETAAGSATLRAYFPIKYSVTRRAEYKDGRLIIYEWPSDKSTSTTLVELYL